MNAILDQWNNASPSDAADAMLACCGAHRWASEMVALRPFINVMELRMAADRIWKDMHRQDWLEAFAAPSRLNEFEPTSLNSLTQEQSAPAASQDVLSQLGVAKREYENHFGFSYIVCAGDETPLELLGILKGRLNNSPDEEMRQAAEQQRLVMQARIGRWLDL